ILKSPRWLLFQRHRKEAHQAFAQIYSNDDLVSTVVLSQLKKIEDTFEYEKNKNKGETLSVSQILKTRTVQKQVLLAISVAVFSSVAGNVIAAYYLNSMLTNVGITNTTRQLQINIMLNAFCLVCCVLRTYYIDSWGHKMTTVISTVLLTIFLFLVGTLTKVFRNSSNTSGVYSTVAMIFLSQGTYSFGWTPFLFSYPPEVNYPIRTNGMGVFQFFFNGAGLLIILTMLIALSNIRWKTYMINRAWNIVMLIVILCYWIDMTSAKPGKTLEEIDELIEGKKHSDVPDLEQIIWEEAQVKKEKH
ncbi:general substrate transporter, partial [Lentinula edodes]